MNKFFTDLNDLAKARFFFDDIGVRKGIDVGESPFVEGEDCFNVDFFELVGFAEIFHDSKDIRRGALGMKFENNAVEKAMFGTVEVVGIEDSGNLRDNFSLSNEHCGQNVLFHGNGIREIIVILIQIQHNLSFFSVKTKRRHSLDVNAV